MSEFEKIKNMINLKKDIKNFYNIKRIFSFLDHKEKLKMIIYNKKLQKKLGVGIQDYKNISGRYKIDEKNGKGKEYTLNTNKLIFEGEYLNGKRNGEGKEYYLYGELKFEGEYLKGERWHGKGYNKNGIVDLEIKNGSGKGKEYYNNGNLEFEGEYLNGRRKGKGKEYYENGKLKFDGE